MALDEKQLINMAKRGNMAALEKLYTLNREKIYYLAYSFVHNSDDAEDLMQEIFIRGFLRLAIAALEMT